MTMTERSLAFVYTPAIEPLAYPLDCPFKTQRAPLTRSKINTLGLLDGPRCQEVTARRATPAELRRIHSASYLEELQRAAKGDLTAEGFFMGLG